MHVPYGKPAPDKYLQRFRGGSKRVDNFYAYLSAADEGLGKIRVTLAELGQEHSLSAQDNGASSVIAVQR